MTPIKILRKFSQILKNKYEKEIFDHIFHFLKKSHEFSKLLQKILL